MYVYPYVFSTLLASSRHFILVKLAFGTKPQPPQNEKFKKKKNEKSSKKKKKRLGELPSTRPVIP